jgi:hypothetical protein
VKKFVKEHKKGISAVAIAVAVTLFFTTGPPFWFRWLESGHGSGPPTPAITQTSAGSSSPAPVVIARKLLYLDSMAPSAGGPVGRGQAIVGGTTYTNSIWIPFVESCCGSDQSVTYQVPSGYRDFDGLLGESTLAGVSGSYVLDYSVTVNGVTAISDRQIQVGDPPVSIQVPLPSGSSSVLIDVTASCPYVICGGNAVIANARIIPQHGAAA